MIYKVVVVVVSLMLEEVPLSCFIKLLLLTTFLICFVDVLEKRDPFRAGHLDLAKAMCLSGGPCNEPGSEVPSGAFFIFADLESAQKFAKEDPYVEGGIVTKSEIKEWNVAIEN